MPWIMRAETSDQRELYWQSIDENGDPANHHYITEVHQGGAVVLYKEMDEPDYSPPESMLPLHFRQSTNHKVLPDFMSGSGGTIFVSQKMRRLIEDMDPETHHYFPITLHTKAGDVIENEYFLFKFGSFIDDGIIVDKSQVGPIVVAGKLGFYSTPARPKLVWKKAKIAGRHVWADRYLKDRFCVSDAFFEEVSRLKIKLFRAIESFEE